MTEPKDPFAAPDQPEGQHDAAGYPPPPPAYGYGEPPAAAPGQPGKTNTLAIIALVAAVLCGPLGIVLGVVAKNQIRERGEGGSGLATAAIIVGTVFFLLGIANVTGAFDTGN